MLSQTTGRRYTVRRRRPTPQRQYRLRQVVRPGSYCGGRGNAARWEGNRWHYVSQRRRHPPARPTVSVPVNGSCSVRRRAGGRMQRRAIMIMTPPPPQHRGKRAGERSTANLRHLPPPARTPSPPRTSVLNVPDSKKVKVAHTRLPSVGFRS